MPFNGAGVFSQIYNWQTDKANGIKIRADRMDGQDGDIATGLSTAICRDGQSVITANLPMATFKHTGVGAATNATDYLRADQEQNNSLTYFTLGSTDGYDLTPVPAITAYAAGQGWWVKVTNANTSTAPTVNVSGLGAITVTKNGAAALAAGDMAAGAILRIQYDSVGPKFQLAQVVTAPYTLPTSVLNLEDLGTKTTSFTWGGTADARIQAYCNTVTPFVLKLGPSTTTHGRLLMYVKTGPYPMFICGTINNIAATIGISDRQTGFLTYNTTEGWI